MTRFIWVRAFLAALFLSFPLLGVENFRIHTEYGLISIPLMLLVVLLLTSLPSFSLLIKRLRSPIVLVSFGVAFFWLFSVFDLSRAMSQAETLSVILKRTIGFFTFLLMLILLNARLISIERLLDLFTVSAAVFLSFVAFMSIIVHRLPYVIPDPLYAQTYNKNQVAVLAVFSLVCSLYLCLKSFRYSRLVTLCTLTVIIFLTYSRASWLISFIVLLVMLVHDLRRKQQIISLRTVSISALALLLIWVSSIYILDNNFVARALDSLVFWVESDEYTGDTKRSALINQAIAEFINNPVLGIGTGNFYAQYPLQTHNSYLQILAENGLITFFILFASICFVGYRLVLAHQTAETGLGLGLFVYFTCYMSVMNLLEFQLLYIALAIFFICTEGIGFNKRQEKGR